MTRLLQSLRFDEPVAVIGDIHGCCELLAALLARLGAMPLLVIGDVIDRGPDSRAVVDILAERGARGVLGNHEEWFMAWFQGRGLDDLALRDWMGGRETLASYGVVGTTPREVEGQGWRLPQDHRVWFESLALAIDLEVQGRRYWIVHAGIPGHLELPRRSRADAIPWLVEAHPRDMRWTVTAPEDMPAVDRTVIMGHVVQDNPRDLGHVIAIDTGAGTLGEKGRLTAVVLPERKFVTVGHQSTPARRP
jgi:serine/threonine protein phosphatase 1